MTRLKEGSHFKEANIRLCALSIAVVSAVLAEHVMFGKRITIKQKPVQMFFY